jgi:hypothetical protein
MRKCIVLAFDCILIVLTLLLILIGIVSITRQVSSEKSLSSTGTGIHLLACPELLDTRDAKDEDVKQRFNNIHLHRDHAEKLLSELQLSLEHARYVHAGETWSASSDIRYGSSQDIQIGGKDEIDINVPRKRDNKMLCQTLKDILDNRIGIRQDSESYNEEDYVTISINQLNKAVSNSMFLRGSRWIHKLPLLENFLKITDVSSSYDNFVKSVQEVLMSKLDQEKSNYAMIN